MEININKLNKELDEINREIQRIDKNYKLCYVERLSFESVILYFTPFDANEVNGDDWNDVPFEHNAGNPYDKYGAKTVILHYIKGIKMPNDSYLNSPYSVNMINNKDVAWLEIDNVKYYANDSR